ncbi:hypothetical protein VTI28DRAFT_7268 [Corynascus sepedonium]
MAPTCHHRTLSLSKHAVKRTSAKSSQFVTGSNLGTTGTFGCCGTSPRKLGELCRACVATLSRLCIALFSSEPSLPLVRASVANDVDPTRVGSVGLAHASPTLIQHLFSQNLRMPETRCQRAAKDMVEKSARYQRRFDKRAIVWRGAHATTIGKPSQVWKDPKIH